MSKRVNNRRGSKRTKKRLARITNRRRKAHHERRSYAEVKKLAIKIVAESEARRKASYVDFFGGPASKETTQ